MDELVYLIIAIFVAYVIYGIVSEKKSTATTSPDSQKKPSVAAKPARPRSAPKTKKAADVKSVAAVANPPEPTSAPQDASKRGLKDPTTGEVFTAYSNYRFTKRWIKEALVAEKLLDKIYKNDELTADIEANIKSAVIKLEAIEKYRA
ncbi:MAG: hypothetical protein HOP23_13755 [Methylococcaceae bacterium]|nr:hypothetical protein [Methylococcaceae bacterium]